MRAVPFDKNAECDECGCKGAFDFMGDFYCGDCAKKLMNENIDCELGECPHCNYEKSFKEDCEEK